MASRWARARHAGQRHLGWSTRFQRRVSLGRRRQRAGNVAPGAGFSAASSARRSGSITPGVLRQDGRHSKADDQAEKTEQRPPSGPQVKTANTAQWAGWPVAVAMMVTAVCAPAFGRLRRELPTLDCCRSAGARPPWRPIGFEQPAGARMRAGRGPTAACSPPRPPKCPCPMRSRLPAWSSLRGPRPRVSHGQSRLPKVIVPLRGRRSVGLAPPGRCGSPLPPIRAPSSVYMVKAASARWQTGPPPNC